jgi:hypothetical protein
MNKMSRSIQNGSRRGGGSTSEMICVEVAPTTPSALAAVASRLLIPERSLPLLARRGDMRMLRVIGSAPCPATMMRNGCRAFAQAASSARIGVGVAPIAADPGHRQLRRRHGQTNGQIDTCASPLEPLILFPTDGFSARTVGVQTMIIISFNVWSSVVA